MLLAVGDAFDRVISYRDIQSQFIVITAVCAACAVLLIFSILFFFQRVRYQLVISLLHSVKTKEAKTIATTIENFIHKVNVFNFFQAILLARKHQPTYFLLTQH